MNFKSARAVYEELGKYGDIENQVLCRERIEELEPSIRYCLHKVGKSSIQTSELLDIGKMERPALDLFKAKLEGLMQELKSLLDNCRSNSYIEHAAGIMEEEKAPEKLSKGVSSLSLEGAEKKESGIKEVNEPSWDSSPKPT
ncbi:uncharacterized protein LOC143860782 isoform X3 [Tasmannia lanceolata]|uniref:uncharacterized protein LOC143860782 isoform X3 n=1 Tax=Tasmannia lanceolata TaxID=3420 RepID=UPI0040645C7F